MKHKKLAIVALAIALLMGVVSAAVIPYFGQIKTTTTVDQAVLVDDHSYNPIEETATVGGGESFWRYHWLTSMTSVPVPLEFLTSFAPALADDEITVLYTTTITEGTYAEYPDLLHQLVALPISGMTLNDLLALDLEYTVNVRVNTGLASHGYRGFAPCINIWITDNTNTYVVENWGDPWSDETIGIKVVTWADLTAAGSGMTIRDYLGQPWGDVSVPQPTDIPTEYGTWEVTEVEVRAQGGASEGQVIRPTQFKVAGRTIDLPDAYSLTGLTLPPYVILKFAICYSFDLLIKAGTYNIYTTIQPPP